MSDRMEHIKEESKKLGESIQLSRDVTDFFLTATVDFADGVVLATMATMITRYCDERGIRAEEFVDDLAHSVKLMAKYRV